MKLGHIKVKEDYVTIDELNSDRPSNRELLAEAMHELQCLAKDKRGERLPFWIDRQTAIQQFKREVRSLLA